MRLGKDLINKQNSEMQTLFFSFAHIIRIDQKHLVLMIGSALEMDYHIFFLVSTMLHSIFTSTYTNKTRDHIL